MLQPPPYPETILIRHGDEIVEMSGCPPLDRVTFDPKERIRAELRDILAQGLPDDATVELLIQYVHENS